LQLVNRRVLKRFSLGLDHFLKNRWYDAHVILKSVNALLKDDGPTNYLLDFMKEHNYIFPKRFEKIREVTF
jgi:hypothetical protein